MVGLEEAISRLLNDGVGIRLDKTEPSKVVLKTANYFLVIRADEKGLHLQKFIENSVKLRPTSEYPCQFDDLVDFNGETKATVYTAKEAPPGMAPGIYISNDGIYDIVTEEKELTEDSIRQALKELSAVANREHELRPWPSPEVLKRCKTCSYYGKNYRKSCIDSGVPVDPANPLFSCVAFDDMYEGCLKYQNTRDLRKMKQFSGSQ